MAKSHPSCTVHGTQHILVEQMAPDHHHKFRVRCTACTPSFLKWASPKQVMEMLNHNPNIETKRHDPNVQTEFEKRFGSAA